MKQTLLALVAMLALAACGDDGRSSSEAREEKATTTTVSTTTTTAAVTTAATAPPTTAAPPMTEAPAAVAQTCASPAEAAMSLHDAWAVGDQAAAARCATPEAVNTLFGGPGGPAAGEYFAGCFGEESPVPCSYAYEGGAITFTIECAASLGTGCQVTEVSFVAD